MNVAERIPRDTDSTVCDPLSRFAEVNESPTPEQAMMRACSRLRNRVGETFPPFGLRALLRAVRARVTERTIGSAGRLEVEDNDYVVVVQTGNHWRRQRFTIAHELGHILILESLADDPTMLNELRRDENWHQLERLCNFAAAEILIPEDDLIRILHTLSPDTNIVRTLYDRYLCSLAPLFIRLVSVFDGLSVSLWREHARHGGEQRRFRVAQCYGSHRKTWMPEGMTAKHLSPDIIRVASDRGIAYDRSVLFTLSSQKRNLCGVANELALGRGNPLINSLPYFQGLAVPDETMQERTIALLLWPKGTSATDSSLFRSLVPVRRGNGEAEGACA